MTDPVRLRMHIAVLAARALFLVSALVWAALAALTLHDRPDVGCGAWVIAAMMILYAGALVWIAWRLGTRQRRRSYYFAIATVIVTLILTITDQFGFWDLIVLILNLVLLALLIATRRRYLEG